MDECPVRTFIPIYLLVSGVFSTCFGVTCIMQIAFLAADCERAAAVMSAVLCVCYICDGIIGFFIAIWYLVGKCLHASV